MAKTIIIGSSVFFSNIKDYKIKDIDEMVIQNKWLPDKLTVLNFKKDNKDVFLWSPLTKEEFIQDTLNSDLYMKVGKFIIPEFCEYIGFKIEDYKRIYSYFENLDNKHKYEKIIVDAYIENNSFTLTEEQINKAYESYKKARNK